MRKRKALREWPDNVDCSPIPTSTPVRVFAFVCPTLGAIGHEQLGLTERLKPSAYNTQVVVEEGCQLIVAQAVTQEAQAG